MRPIVLLGLVCGLASGQSSDVVIERHGSFSTLSVNTFRPLDAVATALEAFGLTVGVEDPHLFFRGDLKDISGEQKRVRPGTTVPARWGFDVKFAVTENSLPADRTGLFRDIVSAANIHSQFAYRLDEDNGAFLFVPTRARDRTGKSVPDTPLLDRLVTIPAGTRRILESATLMAQDLSEQTGLHVSCCQSSIAGYPWGVESVFFAAAAEPARSVLRRLGLRSWHMRCGQENCFIDLR